jgi:glycosyltransferase involved in cell wall biosynthesis
MLIHILTRCSRAYNLSEIYKTIKTDIVDIKWWILFDINSIETISVSVLQFLDSIKAEIRYGSGESNSCGMNLINDVLEEISDGWVYILDDDNLIHPNFYISINEIILNNLDKTGIIFNQKVGGIDFSGLDIREARSENVKVGSIDSAQYFLHRDLISESRYILGDYKSDGYFIVDLYENNKDKFLFIEEELCYYNKIEKSGINSYPRILIFGIEEEIKLQSKQMVDFEARDMDCKFYKTDDNLINIINNFNPDAIITVGEDYGKFPNLGMQSLDIRKRWLHVSELNESVGEMAYNCANSYILDKSDKNTPLVSLFTPIYNTGKKLWRAYESVRNQTYNNWEWVLVNDSTDEGKTLKIAEQIADVDCRVKVYDFKKKSGGIIGESKYRAACLCSGDYLMEFDHDDYLTNEAIYWMVEAFKKYSDAKFVYSDCAEIFENHESLTYGDGFAFGYGTYRDEIWNGRLYKAMNTVNINPKTIRHIVGVPNHFRAWERKFYHSIGGHNRRLTIADDYELIVRTFLNTRMVRIPKLLYLQFYHNSNTQNSTRADIQRRVKSIKDFYNQRIYERFIELGVNDWAYEGNPWEPLLSESKFGIEENYVNYIFDNKVDVNINHNYVNNFAYRI